MNRLTVLFLILSLTGCKTSAPKETMGSGIIKIDGTELHYVVMGTGPDCLVIGSSVYYPKTFSEKLAGKMKMYYVDMKWFAEKYKPEDLGQVTINSIADDVEEIRKAPGLKKPILLGHSIRIYQRVTAVLVRS